MNVLNLVKTENRKDGRTWFAVDPAIAYPAMIKFFVLAKEDEQTAEEIPAQYRRQALALDDSSSRAVVIDLARLVLTEMLHQQIKQEPMGIHILKNPEWKL